MYVCLRMCMCIDVMPPSPYSPLTAPCASVLQPKQSSVCSMLYHVMEAYLSTSRVISLLSTMHEQLWSALGNQALAQGLDQDSSLSEPGVRGLRVCNQERGPPSSTSAGLSRQQLHKHLTEPLTALI